MKRSSDAVLADSPSGYWRLGDPAGATTAAATRGQAGTYRGVSAGADGVIDTDGDGAASFPGGADLTYSNDVNFDATCCFFGLGGTGTLTLEAWIRTETSDNGVVAAESDGAGPIWTVSIDNGYPRFWFKDCCGNFVPAYGPEPVADGAAHHVVVARRNVDIAIYVDGAVAVSPWQELESGEVAGAAPEPIGNDSVGLSIGDAAGEDTLLTPFHGGRVHPRAHT